MHAGLGSCLVTVSKQFKVTAQNFLHMQYMVGASLSEPHTSVTALQDACVCMSVCVRTYVREAIYRKF